MASDAASDPAAADRERLCEELSYRSLQHDLDRLLDDLERPLFAEAERAGRGYYGVASELVVDCYYARGAYEPLVKAYAGQPYRVASRFERLLRHLLEAERHDLIERFWVDIARLTRADHLLQRSPGEDPASADPASADPASAERRGHALEAYEQAIEWLRRIDREAVADELAAEREALRDDRLPTLPPATDARRIDETVFWELLASAHAAASTTPERVVALGERLRAFEAKEIRRFAALYGRWMKTLHHWNVWALAWAARGGCSDACFESFRAWLLLEGDAELAATAIKDPARAAERVPPEPDLPPSHLLSVIEEAFLLRRGEPLDPPSIENDRPKGREWAEDELATRHPRLVERYASVL